MDHTHNSARKRWHGLLFCSRHAAKLAIWRRIITIDAPPENTSTLLLSTCQHHHYLDRATSTFFLLRSDIRAHASTTPTHSFFTNMSDPRAKGGKGGAAKDKAEPKKQTTQSARAGLQVSIDQHS